LLEKESKRTVEVFLAWSPVEPGTGEALADLESGWTRREASMSAGLAPAEALPASWTGRKKGAAAD
jgi:hypothetical protein